MSSILASSAMISRPFARRTITRSAVLICAAISLLLGCTPPPLPSLWESTSTTPTLPERRLVGAPRSTDADESVTETQLQAFAADDPFLSSRAEPALSLATLAPDPDAPVILGETLAPNAAVGSPDFSDIRGSAPADRPGHYDLWETLASNMHFTGESPARFERQRRWLRANRRHIVSVFERGRQYLPYIIERVNARGMPAEIALLPAVESGFRPGARSPLGAVGLWQFMPRTGKALGLRDTPWYDARKDVVASTDAALDYLEHLTERFSGNWLLGIAAYNCGAGPVLRALKRAGKTAAEADIWDVIAHLPSETRQYIPRLLAISDWVTAPASYRIELPDTSAEPYFTVVDTGSQIDMGLAAKLANVDPEVLYRLNPHVVRWATDPEGPHRLLVPAGHAATLTAKLAGLSKPERLAWKTHHVRANENFGVIARRYGLTSAELMAVNELKSPRLHAGRALLVPAAGYVPGVRPSHPPSRPSIATYRVRSGDSLWLIARRHNTTVAKLTKLNGLSRRSVLRPGRTLRVPAKKTPRSGRT